MEMQKGAPVAPDTFGIPEYKVSEVITEIDGPDVRIVCGVRRFGEVHWLYSVVINAEVFLRLDLECRQAAEQAINLQHIVERRGSH